MKHLQTKTVLAAVVIFISLPALNAEMGWFWQNPLPPETTLQGLSFSDESNGTVVGNYGTIVRTTDGGITWTVQASGTMETLREVSFTDANHGTAVGDNGIILNTIDGGETWDAQISGTNDPLYGVSFSDANHGTVVGMMGIILRTIDGGNNWTPQQSGLVGFYGALLSVSFVDANNGIIVGTDGTILHTMDGGVNWALQSSGTSRTLSGVSFIDVNSGIAVGSAGTVLKTIDAGTNWDLTQITENSLYDVSYTDINNIIIVGQNGYATMLTDGGTVSHEFHLTTGESFYGASLNTFVGENGQVFCFSNDGTTCDNQSTGTVSWLYGVAFTSQNIGTVVGHRGQILRTTDGGDTWIYQTYESPNSDTINDTFRDVSFFDTNYGAICGAGATQWAGSFVCCTINGGSTWNVIFNSSNVRYQGISSVSTTTYIAVGRHQGYAAYGKTTNGGTNWDSYAFENLTDPLYDVSFVDENIGTAVGDNGIILRTTNGAESWSLQTSYTSANLRGVNFTDANHGTAVGNSGTILHTADGGTSWNSQSSGTNEQLCGVSFIDENNGTVVGKNGIILNTTDGGTTWEIQPVGTSEDLFCVSFADENYGNIAGGRGVILRTISGGVTSIIEEKTIRTPETFVLLQNYPNPFNPTTTISYMLPEHATTKLTIFNIRGHEVVALLNADKPPGSYEVQWNGLDQAGNQVSTGVYFCRLETGSYNQTIKMVYLR